MKENPIRDLLAQGNWGEDQALLQGAEAVAVCTCALAGL